MTILDIAIASLMIAVIFALGIRLIFAGTITTYKTKKRNFFGVGAFTLAIAFYALAEVIALSC